MLTEYRVVISPAEFAALRGDWNDLCRRTAVDHAFMRHEWFAGWWEHFGRDDRLMILTARTGGALVGIAPLRVVTRKKRGVPLRVLTFLQSGVTPRCNFITHPELDADDFFSALLATRGWHIMELGSLEVDQAITRSFIGFLSRGRRHVVEAGLSSPYEVLSGSWEEFERSRPTRCRKSFRTAANRLARAGGHEFLVLETPDQFRQHFDDLVAVSRRSWKGKIGTDLGSRPHLEAFLRGLSCSPAAESLCRAYLLRIDGRPAGFDFYLREGRRLVGIRWDFDERFTYYTPGVNLHRFVIADLLGSNEAWEYDLAGLDSDYKTELVKSLRRHVNITVGRPGPIGTAILKAKQLLLPRT